MVSPKDLRLSAPYLSAYSSPPIQLLQLPSGLTVLHTPRFSPRNFGNRLISSLNYRHTLYISTLAEELEEAERIRDGLNFLEISKEEGIPFGVVRELVEMVENGGGICRDDQAVDGVRWFNNFFS